MMSIEHAIEMTSLRTFMAVGVVHLARSHMLVVPDGEEPYHVSNDLKVARLGPYMEPQTHYIMSNGYPLCDASDNIIYGFRLVGKFPVEQSPACLWCLALRSRR